MLISILLLMINLFIFLIGTAIGSFLNVLIDRLPNNESIAGRSHCDHCKKQVAWFDLIPVFTFFILKGKSRCCQKKLSFQYLLIEILTGILFILIFNFQFSIFNQFLNFNNLILISNYKFQISNLLVMWGIVSCFIVIVVSDFKYHLISDYLLVALLVFSLLFHINNNETINQFINFFLSSLIVALPIFFIYYLSKEKAMGQGDVYLAAIIGFLLGWQKGFLALYIAFVSGAIIGVSLMILQRKKIKSRIAFGPFIILGTVVMMFYGERILEIIKKIYGF